MESVEKVKVVSPECAEGVYCRAKKGMVFGSMMVSPYYVDVKGATMFSRLKAPCMWVVVSCDEHNFQDRIVTAVPIVERPSDGMGCYLDIGRVHGKPAYVATAQMATFPIGELGAYMFSVSDKVMAGIEKEIANLIGIPSPEVASTVEDVEKWLYEIIEDSIQRLKDEKYKIADAKALESIAMSFGAELDSVVGDLISGKFKGSLKPKKSGFKENKDGCTEKSEDVSATVEAAMKVVDREVALRSNERSKGQKIRGVPYAMLSDEMKREVEKYAANKVSFRKGPHLTGIGENSYYALRRSMNPNLSTR